jgi:hypothetical protein
MAFAALRAGELRAWVRGVADGLRGADAALATRRALRPATYDRLRRIRALKPGVIARVRRHVSQRLI